MEKIRLLHCIETISSGGVEKIRLTFAKSLDFDKYELKIICTQAAGPIKDQLVTLGIEIIEVGSFKTPFEWKKYKKVLQVIWDYQPHIIHGAVYEGMSMATVGGVFGRVPVIVLEETSYPSTRSKKALILQKSYSIFADKVIGVAPTVVKFLKEKVKIKPEKVILINNGVDTPSSTNQDDHLSSREKFGFHKNDFIIGSVGRVHDKIKRFSDILEALHILRNPRLKFLLVGQGPDLDHLKIKAEKLGLKEQFVHVGYQENTYPFYKIMDIFCLVSAHEGLPLVAMEAMLHRLSVIATKVGGLQDIVLDHETGFLIPPNSPKVLAEKLQVLIDQPKLKKAFGEKGYQRAIANYTEKQYCENLFKLYDVLLQQKGISI